MVETTIQVASVAFDRETRPDGGTRWHTGTVTFTVPERGLTFQCRFRTASRDETDAMVAAARNLQVLTTWIHEAAETFIAARRPAPEPAATPPAASAMADPAADPDRSSPFRLFRRRQRLS